MLTEVSQTNTTPTAEPATTQTQIDDIRIPLDEALRTEIQEVNNDKPEEQETKISPLKSIIINPNHRNIFIGVINGLLHGAAAVTSFDQLKKSGLMQGLNKFFDRAAFLLTRWVAPISSYGFAAVESIINGRLVEGVIKLIPPLFLPVIGDANIDSVYGACTGVNRPYDMVVERLDAKSKESPEFARMVEESNRTPKGNAKLIWQEVKEMLGDFFNGKMKFIDNLYISNTPLNLIGSLPILLFARKARDTWFARILGAMRSLGSAVGDTALFLDKEIYKKLMASFFTTATIADVAKRWVKSDIVARILIHLSATFNVAAVAVWNAATGSKQKEDVEKKSIKP